MNGKIYIIIIIEYIIDLLNHNIWIILITYLIDVFFHPIFNNDLLG